MTALPRLSLAALAVCVALPALAQGRDQTLARLSHVIGESHALRQTCQGGQDQYWREWMGRLIQSEAPGEAIDAAMRQAFNQGYAEARARYPDCTAAAREAAARAAREGRALARTAGGA